MNRKILFEQTVTAGDFESRFNAHRRSIYGILSNNRCEAFLRPQNRVKEIKGNTSLAAQSTQGDGSRW
jgi:hypothetical protein